MSKKFMMSPLPHAITSETSKNLADQQSHDRIDQLKQNYHRWADRHRKINEARLSVTA
ncbi:hypothetical protein X737_29090 [Mesorhizobium sp. L48C026A00]|nr:hypothetical protein X737_29090 [Mesorhizobium sp. L48C026A00]